MINDPSVNSNKQSDTNLMENLLRGNQESILGGKGVKLIELIPEEDRERAIQLAKQFDFQKQHSVVFFGTAAQSKLLSFSHSMLEHVQKKDIGEVGEVIGDLVEKLNEVSPDDLKPKGSSFFQRLFGRVSGSVQEILSRYQKTAAQIDRISVKLARSKNILLADVVMLDRLYETNQEYFYNLNVYMAAVEIKLEEIYGNTIPELKEIANGTSDQMKSFQTEDMVEFAQQLEKRLYDLKISREITIQTAPQIRMIQHTNQLLIEKIQSSIMTAIPLWKNQVTIALSLLNQRNAAKAQKNMSKATNILQSNTETLRNYSVETADISTLKKTQNNLLLMLEETLQIQDEGLHNRIHAKQELTLREMELKQVLKEVEKG